MPNASYSIRARGKIHCQFSFASLCEYTHTHVSPLKVSVTRHYILQSLSVDLVSASHISYLWSTVDVGDTPRA